MFNIKKFKEILTTINSIGIKRVIFTHNSENQLFIFGRDDRSEIAIFDECDLDLEQNICIPDISQFLNKINLFDLDKCDIQLSNQGRGNQELNFFSKLHLKQGRRKINISFSDPGLYECPKRKLEDTIKHVVELDAEKVQEILSSITAVQGKTNIDEKYFTIIGNGKEIIYTLRDGEGNDFSDVMGENDGSEWSENYGTDYFTRILKQKLKNKDELFTFKISQRNIMYVYLNNIEIIITRKIVN